MSRRLLRPLVAPLRVALAAAALAAGCRASPPAAAPEVARPERPAAAQASTPGATRGQLATVRPPPPPCGPAGAPRLLAQRATDALDRGDADRGLACAEQALRVAPRLLAALRARAQALAELDRADDARTAFARALAVAPDDPETLLGAAELYTTRLGGDRAHLELGLEYALRGLHRARDGGAQRAAVLAPLLLVAAGAENALGLSRDALAHADAVLAAEPADVDGWYERGVALYELCRFGEAREALERARAADPDDAWTLHYLALVAERSGQGHHAEELERRARTLAPSEFRGGVQIDRAAFEAEVRRAIDALPARERRSVAAVPVEVEDVPSLDDLTAVDPPLSPSILGLFRGPSQDEACLPDDGPRCRSIVLYRVNLARFARSAADLSEQVRVTLLHEIGHLQGESEDELRARGLE